MAAHVLTAVIRKKILVSSQCSATRGTNPEILGFVKGGFHCYHLAIIFLFYYNGVFVLLRCLITTRGGIKSVFDGFIALIYQEGER